MTDHERAQAIIDSLGLMRKCGNWRHGTEGEVDDGDGCAWSEDCINGQRPLTPAELLAAGPNGLPSAELFGAAQRACTHGGFEIAFEPDEIEDVRWQMSYRMLFRAGTTAISAMTRAVHAALEAKNV